MMKRDLKPFIAERAEHLAFIHLTRRKDLIVERMHSPDHVLDMLVTRSKNGFSTGRVFGIQVKGQDKPLKNIETFSSLLLREDIDCLHEIPFPVCLLLFTMDEDKGYYGWINQPVIEPDPVSHLHTVKSESWHNLDEVGINQIIHDVDAWYDAKSRLIA